MFTFDLEMNLEQLYHELITGRYRHGPYRIFTRCDPKPRRIAVPCVRDQIVHRLLTNAIGTAFEHSFHPHSYASRPGKGVLAAAETVHRWVRDCSDGGRQRCWALRMDVRKYFASIDHHILTQLLSRRVAHPWRGLCEHVLASFGEDHDGRRVGLPLGNVTSQLFANVYLHELDRFVAHTLTVRRYARYMDDWVIVARDRDVLTVVEQRCRVFLRDALRLDAPPEKTSIVPVHRGIDWLGFRLFPHHRVLRTVTLRRLRRRIQSRVFAYLDTDFPRDQLRATFASYDGLLRSASHSREWEALRVLDRCVG